MAAAWFGILCFTFQIYFDFSGYSDMAVGLGKMLGFSFPKNFNYPYLSKSVTEFWRRWHITLGLWFRNFVYIPLGGNRCGKLKQIRNILVVWFLTGFWHGASWNFALWGLYYGVILIIEKFFLRKYLERLPGAVRILYSFLLVVFGWVFFEFDKLGDVAGFFSCLFGVRAAGFIDGQTIYWIYTNALPFIACAVFSTRLPAKLAEWVRQKSKKAAAVLSPVLQAAGLLACTAFLVNASYNPFLYFRF